MKKTYTTIAIIEFDDEEVEDCIYDIDNPLNKEDIITNEIKTALEYVKINVLNIETKENG